MSTAPATASRRLRILGVVWLVLFLLWLPFEDTQLTFPLILALDLCVWLALRMWPFWSTLGRVAATLVAAAWLASAPVLTLGLMVFKGGVHAHGFPDFALRQFAAVLSALPLCALLGGLMGLGAHILLMKK
ncbi:MAG: hypothetical protein KIT29_01575 [Anaerolineales bacterium]|nr:hypothetical protein [Anaerolineales bacterium]